MVRRINRGPRAQRAVGLAEAETAFNQYSGSGAGACGENALFDSSGLGPSGADRWRRFVALFAAADQEEFPSFQSERTELLRQSTSGAFPTPTKGPATVTRSRPVPRTGLARGSLTRVDTDAAYS